MANYTVLDHTADTGVEASAATLSELIGSLAAGMFGLIAVVESCESEHVIEVSVSAPNDTDLVFEALSELLYMSEVENLLLCEFSVAVEESERVHISATGIPFQDVDVCGPPIKAVTYHQMEVTQTETGWYGRVYFDV